MDRLGIYTCPHCDTSLDVEDISPFEKVSCPDCSQSFIVPAKLDHFFVYRKLGSGGMGVVFLARDEQLNREVAIKVLRKNALEKENAIEQFSQEAIALAALTHPNIATVYSYNAEPDRAYIVMEYIRGQSLDEVLKSGNTLDESMLTQVAIQMVEALACANDASIIHSDIKPANIVITPKGQALLVDFGLAHFGEHSAMGTAKSIWGTPFYVPPELLARKPDNNIADQYRLGATLWHMVTGEPPFNGEDGRAIVKAIRNTDNPRLLEHMPGVLPLLAEVVERMMAKKPGHRYPTYASLLSDLYKVQEQLQHRKVLSESAKIQSPATSYIKWISLSLMGAILLAAGIAAAVIHHRAKPKTKVNASQVDLRETSKPTTTDRNILPSPPPTFVDNNLFRNADFFMSEESEAKDWELSVSPDPARAGQVKIAREESSKIVQLLAVNNYSEKVMISQTVHNLKPFGNYRFSITTRFKDLKSMTRGRPLGGELRVLSQTSELARSDRFRNVHWETQQLSFNAGTDDSAIFNICFSMNAPSEGSMSWTFPTLEFLGIDQEAKANRPE